MITIAGLGSSGAYLLRRLSQDGFGVTGYDPKPDSYYIPCGYALKFQELAKILANVGMEADRYVLSMGKEITIGGESTGDFRFNLTGLCTVDKNLLEKDLVSGLRRERRKAPSSSDMLIDATGVSRYYLGPARDDFAMYAREVVTVRSTHQDFYMSYFPSGKGYYWEFPIGDRFHVGVGTSDPEYFRMLPAERERVVGRKIRLKPLLDQAARGNVIGIGEAIGTVSPITGEGIIPSMKSAEILYQCLRNHGEIERVVENYLCRIREEFSRYPRLFELLQRFRSGRKGIGNIRFAREAIHDLRGFGIDFRLWKVASSLI